MASCRGVGHDEAGCALDILRSDREVARVGRADDRLQFRGVYALGVSAGDDISSVGFCGIIQGVYHTGAVLAQQQAGGSAEGDGGVGPHHKADVARVGGPAGGGVEDPEAGRPPSAGGSDGVGAAVAGDTGNLHSVYAGGV